LTRQLTDSGGTVALAQSYDPFGATIQTSGTTQTMLGFDGQQTDSTGLQYLHASAGKPNACVPVNDIGQ